MRRAEERVSGPGRKEHPAVLLIGTKPPRNRAEATSQGYVSNEQDQYIYVEKRGENSSVYLIAVGRKN